MSSSENENITDEDIENLDEENNSCKQSFVNPQKTKKFKDIDNSDSDEEQEKKNNLDNFNIGNNNLSLNNEHKNNNIEDEDSFPIISNTNNKEKEINKDGDTKKKKSKSKQQGNLIIMKDFNYSKKKKMALYLQKDEEKSKNEEHVVYEISTMRENKNKELEKNILSYRRYNNFKTFNKVLKSRYPHVIFPFLSPEETPINFGENIIFSNKEAAFLEQRRKELQYYINEIYNNKHLQGEEFKKFINDATFDEKYFSSLGKHFYYPESSKALKKDNKSVTGLLNKGIMYIGYVYKKYKGTNGNDPDETKNEKKILENKKKINEKIKKCENVLNEVKIIYQCLKNEKKERKCFYTNLSYLNGDTSGNNNKLNGNTDEEKFNELINMIQEADNNDENEEEESLNYFENEIIDTLDYYLLDLKGEYDALKRYESFLDKYKKIINLKDKNNKDISEEQISIKSHIDIYENMLIKEMERVDEKYNKIFPNIINNLSVYINKSLSLTTGQFEKSSVIV